jgi:periplasmic divalent cation tolerance protein
MDSFPKEYLLVYITCKDKAQALEIGQQLVKQKIVACVNILDNMTAIYEWKGEIITDMEVILVAKASKETFAEIEKAVLLLHSYEVPCMVALPIVAGHSPYLDWLGRN